MIRFDDEHPRYVVRPSRRDHTLAALVGLWFVLGIVVFVTEVIA